MQYAVIIPITAHDLLHAPQSFQWLSYFDSHAVKTFVSVNGCSLEEAHSIEQRYERAPLTFHMVYGGEEPNPYKARNAAIAAAFKHQEVEAVALIDSESIVDEGYHACVSHLCHDRIYSGRIKTHIPKGVSTHLDWLADKHFECFDGFNCLTATMGGNMVFGRSVYEALGPMKDDSISGGDHEYGVRAFNKGYLVQPIEALVYKIIHKYSYRTILEKQLRRAQNATSGKLPASQVIPSLREALLRKAAALEGCTKLSDLQGNYDKVIDGLFSVMWFESLLAIIIDEELS
jgi:hypothetical protein